MRAQAIAGFGYNSTPDANRDRMDGIPLLVQNQNQTSSNVVVMEPMIVRADRGLGPQPFRALDSSIHQQEKSASEQKWSIVKVHDVKLSRKFHFGYVTLFGVPVVAGFSW
jgi:hypothetical protein